jgi:hypothetical protein
VNAIDSSLVFDGRYAPEILIFRFTRWPSLADQQALLKSLRDDNLFTVNSSALIDISALDDGELPDPDMLAAGLAQAQAKNSVLKRIACVVRSPEQSRFVRTLQMMAPQPNKIATFFADADALQWLMQSID